jgi:hypothetical protein
MTPPASAQERVLVLCRAIPEESKKYETVVCVAGLTDQGEFRRLYPVPFRPFIEGGGIQFHKKQWITATLEPADARDTRAESRKIDMKSVVTGTKIDDDEVRRIIQPVLSKSIGDIQSKGASLGFIRPHLTEYDFQITEDPSKPQQFKFDPDGNLAGGTKVRLGQESKYTFKCQEGASCECTYNSHHMLILDWEVNELYRNVRKNTPVDQIESKMRAKWLDFMRTRDLYFMMGTHHRWKNWMIVSVLYLRKPDT